MIWLKKADKLIARQVLMTLALIWPVLLAVDLFFALVNEIDEIGQGNYSLTDAATYVVWTIPRRAYELFGVAAVLATAIGLGALAPTSELTALRAAGWSKQRLAWSAVVSVFLLVVPVMWLGNVLGPEGERRAQGLAVGAKSMDMVVTNNTGMWARDGNDLLNAKRGRVLQSSIELIDVRLYQFSEAGQLLAIIHGDIAEHIGGNWLFKNVSQFHFTGNAVNTEHSDRWEWHSAVNPRLMSLSIVQPRYQRLSDLRGHIAYLTRNQLDPDRFLSAYWARIFFPLSVLAPLLIALPVVFGSLRSGGLGKRLFLGIAIAITYFVVLQPTAVNIARVIGISVVWAYTVPSLILVAWGIGRLRRP